MPTRASRRARLQQARLVDYYGTRYWEIIYTHEEAPEERRKAYLGTESVYDDPKAGDHIFVTYTVNTATSIHKTD